MFFYRYPFNMSNEKDTPIKYKKFYLNSGEMQQ